MEHKKSMKNILNKRIFNIEDFTRKDKFGFFSINVLGDSISHGANVEEIYKDSWVALLREKFLKDIESENYGFINCLSPISNEKGIYKELLSFENNDCEIKESDKTVGFYEVIMKKKGCSYTGNFEIEKSLLEIYFKVNTNKSLGRLSLELLDKESNIIEKQIVEINSKTECLVKMQNRKKEKISSIKISNINGENILSGIYLFENVDKPVLNNYSRSGARLHDLNGNIIEDVFNTNILIFSLGHNKCDETEEYLEKCKIALKKYNPKLIVLNFCWNENNEKTSESLKNFARECNGLYIDFTKYGQKDSFLSDKSHPTMTGHRMIYEKIMKMLGEKRE